MNRILIANRGEIAVRIIHACHDTGRTAIAVYADADANALFVQLADEAYPLEGATPAQTYLDIDKIVDAAKRAHADAVHPGYGFLSENADFAQAVIDAGLTWIGPNPDTIRTLGDKVAARHIAAEVGAPMAPGTVAPVYDPKEVVRFAREHGLPLAIKAVHGGGGRGLKVVRRLEDVEEAFLSATHEAEVAFGNGDCFLERFLDRPRHVEVQILADTHGNVVAVGTRDCSLQRRNQKLIEEAPAPFLPAAITDHLKQTAVAICRKAGYVSAGTVEFLVAEDGTMSFMEVNTRIQVEHPVTELTTGIDLVAEQLRIAEGESIAGLAGRAGCAGTAESVETDGGSAATGPQSHGHAIEFRINAEDPSRGFVPFPGHIGVLRAPSGPGIRFDTGVAAGSDIPDQFDSMLAKLVVYAPTREACIRRARRALAELKIEGVPTVVPFDKAVLADPDFASADHLGVYTRWIEETFLPRVNPATLVDGPFGLPDPSGSSGLSGESVASGNRDVAYDRAADAPMRRMWIELDGRRVRLGLPASFAITAAGNGTASSTTDGAADGMSGDDASAPDPNAITSTITGTFVRWLADDGATVAEGDPVAVVEAMKMETQIAAPHAGTLHTTATIGDAVRYGQPIGTVDPA
ncbi:biotin carboxylase N-terminal domain-containing protein [Bifidobacterium biavatii]|uniref:acetyl/propionyl/methylcrotonyl-CoA carboxylase subunit alpha n=1 Tax=Bifidobacterium biavatii TaxID=762212 RepID=UPI00187D9979